MVFSDCRMRFVVRLKRALLQSCWMICRTWPSSLPRRQFSAAASAPETRPPRYTGIATARRSTRTSGTQRLKYNCWGAGTTTKNTGSPLPHGRAPIGLCTIMHRFSGVRRIIIIFYYYRLLSHAGSTRIHTQDIKTIKHRKDKLLILKNIKRKTRKNTNIAYKT